MGNLGYNPYKWSYNPTYNWKGPVLHGHTGEPLNCVGLL